MADPALTVQAAVVALGALALAVVWRRGCLTRAALAAGPVRATGLHPVDLLVALVLMMVGAELAVALVHYVIGGPVTTLEHAGTVLVSQALGQGLPAGYVVLRVVMGGRGAAGVRALGLGTERPAGRVWLAGLALLAGLPMLMALGVVVQWVSAAFDLWAPEVGHDLLIAMREWDSLGGLLAMLFAVVVVASVLEEVIYRGLLQSALQRWLGPGRRWTVVLVASVLFVVVHMGPGTFDPGVQGGVTWNALPTLLALAVILGWLYERSGSLWPPILVHAAFNAFNVALVMWVM